MTLEKVILSPPAKGYSISRQNDDRGDVLNLDPVPLHFITVQLLIVGHWQPTLADDNDGQKNIFANAISCSVMSGRRTGRVEKALLPLSLSCQRPPQPANISAAVNKISCTCLNSLLTFFSGQLALGMPGNHQSCQLS